ncbi:hypothetical protein DFAR_570003 [Desulfarculales bacterium]
MTESRDGVSIWRAMGGRLRRAEGLLPDAPLSIRYKLFKDQQV